MSETDKVFAGSIPENYDRYLVPLIFESFAQDIAQRVAALSPSDRFRNRCWQWRGHSSIGAKTFARRQLCRNRPQPADA